MRKQLWQAITLICMALFVQACSANHKILTQTNTAMKPDSISGYKQVNGIKMYYEIHGKGMPLVLIHGGGSTIRTSFGRILPFLAQHRQVIAVELQGNGHTSDRNAPFTFKQDAADVAELLRQLGISNADFMGFSNGGQTTLQIAMSYPQLTRKIIVASAFTKRSGAQPWFWDFMSKASFKDMPQQYKDEFLSIPGNTQQGLQAMHDKSLYRMQHFEGWTDDEIQTIKVPALIITGDADVAPPEHAVEITHYITNSKLAIFPGGHGEYLGELLTGKKNSRMPELVAALVDEFLGE
ncbi:alpha/beta fold hydrolase [Mucilaginibacter psychrotolerans]|uniref:Alpha/beta hydrolase n=1 Tax=Mucilaginibacter psychrotolerans TaxID=1524096 RepID=A0A4Y8S9T5_9SPHI|nr:alpha/beta hydrolase [Mucilaginibacter psychrotolerans]TFF35779.1 alpha/beta hydrolase [Mucilaginibacter psychrotolerans]